MVGLGKSQSRYLTVWARVAGVPLTLVVLCWMGASPVSATPEQKVVICHGTASVSNAYVREQVNASSISEPNGNPLPNGHGSHTGPVYPAPHWGDIIPPIPELNYPGLNWTENGIAIWEAACDTEFEPEETPPPSPSTPTTSATATETGSPTATATASTSSAATATASATSTATSTRTPSQPAKPSVPPGATVPPESPPPADLPPPVLKPSELKKLAKGTATMPPLDAVAVDPGATVVVLGHLTVSQRAKLAAELHARQLPLGAPDAGQGGASTPNGNTAPWIVAGIGFLLLTSLATIGFWRGRKSS